MNEFTPEYAKIIRDDPRWQALINDYFLPGEFEQFAEQFGKTMAELPVAIDPRYKIQIHGLKTVNPYFMEVWTGRKLFEFRHNDRNFQVGDGLRLNEYIPETDDFADRYITADISYILSDVAGLLPGYVVLGLKPESITCHGG